MKLAKKVLACVVAFALMSVLAVSAFAANGTLGVKAPATAAIGSKIEVVASISGAKELESSTFAVSYDPAYLEFVSVTGAPEAQCGNPEAGLVTAAMAYATTAGYDSKDLITVTFNVLKDTGSTEVKFDVLDDDLSGLDSVTPGSATIKFTEKVTTAAADTTAPTKGGDDTTAPTKDIPKTGDAGVAVAAGLVLLAGAAFVASKKTK